MKDQVEAVLTNWIQAAISPPGQLPKDVSPGEWVADKFLRWWRSDIEGHLDESLGDAERALEGVRCELNRLGGWEKFGEALHECIHLGDALSTLRQTLLPENTAKPNDA
jgi:hypothetical protein